MSFTRRLFFENWRNKIVALIFAVGIWFVAFQSETSTLPATVTVDLHPEFSSDTVIVGTYFDAGGGRRQPFNGRVSVTFSGPRKQIDLLRERLRRQHSVFVPPGVERYELDEGDFGFPRDGVSIAKIEPAVIDVDQEKLVEVAVDNLRDRVQVVGAGSDVEVATEVVRPDWLRFRVPESYAKNFAIRIPIERPVLTRENATEENVAPQVTSMDPDLVARFVRVQSSESTESWVSAKDPPKVTVRVTLRERLAELENDAVRIQFRVPLLPHPYRILLHDEPDGVIPLKFVGPSSEIRRLEAAMRDNPDFAVVVPLPRHVDPSAGGVFTFGEDAIEVPDFPRVKVEQHRSRVAELKGAWSYEVKVNLASEVDR